MLFIFHFEVGQQLAQDKLPTGVCFNITLNLVQNIGVSRVKTLNVLRHYRVPVHAACSNVIIHAVALSLY